MLARNREQQGTTNKEGNRIQEGMVISRGVIPHITPPFKGRRPDARYLELRIQQGDSGC